MKLMDRYVGIMVREADHDPPFQNSFFYRDLCKAAQQSGLSCYIFSPIRIDWTKRKVTGYAWDSSQNRWTRGLFPLPHIVYDRCFFKKAKDILLYRGPIRRLRREQGTLFLSHGLKGKWAVQQLLSKHQAFERYLPPTAIYRGKPMLLKWLKLYKQVFLKPQSGSQGRNTLHISIEDHHIVLRARDSANQLIYETFSSYAALIRYLRLFMRSRTFLLQPYLELTDEQDRAFDVRSMVQKDGSGQWQTIGMAVRHGQPGSRTSNLHGGGCAVEVEPFLTKLYGKKLTSQLLQTMKDLSESIPLYLEQDAGRLVELGIDFGIDRSGKLWILEVNSKPGRSIFLMLNQQQARITSIHNPIRYASFIMERQLGG